jgi:hypothetical protein
MKAYTLIFGFICINFASFALNASGVVPVSRELYVNPTDVSNTFSLTIFAALGAGGAVLGLIGLITRQFYMAAGALVIWVIGIMLPIVQWVFVGLPIMLTALVPSELSWLTGMIGAFFAISLFMFMAELAAGRPVT